MTRLSFVVLSVFIAFANALTDPATPNVNANDLQQILNTQSVQHFRYNYNRDNPSVPTRE